MTTKDYVYLGLILLAALAFYCNGFYAGVYRCKRMYEALLEDSENNAEATDSSPKSGNLFAQDGKQVATMDFSPKREVRPSGHEVRGDFSNN